MFGFKMKHPKGETLILKIDGMHCTSCSLNIDGELEDLEGVISASTSYPKSTCTVQFDAAKTSEKSIKSVISKLGYKVVS